MRVVRAGRLRNILIAVCFLIVSVRMDDALARERNVLFMLDSSGSMWTQIKKENRVVIARETLYAIAPKFRGAFQLGIAGFGHRQAAICGKVQELIPIGPIDEAMIKETLNALKPKGAASIAASLTKGAALLDAGQRPATLILLADGPDNCKADPCAVAQKLAQSSLDLKIHVIAFATRKEERDPLSCMATATGGQFFTAKDRPQLMKAMAQAFAAARDDVKRSAGDGPEIVTGSIRDDDGSVRELERPSDPPPIPAVKPPPPASMIKPEPPKSDTAKSAQGQAPKSKASAQDTKPGLESPGKAAKPGAPQGETKSATKSPAPETAKPSKLAKLDAAVRKPTLTAAIAPEFIVQEQAADHSSVKLKAKITTKLSPISRPVDWSIFRIDPQQQNKWVQVAARRSAEAAFSLAPGEYVVRAAYGHAMAAKIIAVKAKKLSDATFVLNAGAIRVRSSLVSLKIPAGRTATQKIYADGDLAAHRKPLATLVGENDIIRLNAGAYEVVSQYGSANATIKTRVTIRPGRLTEVEINHKAGIARFRLAGVKAEGLAAKAQWRLTDAKGNTVAKASGKAIDPDIFAPGRYTATAQIADKTYRSAFDIAAGQTRDIVIEIK